MIKQNTIKLIILTLALSVILSGCVPVLPPEIEEEKVTLDISHGILTTMAEYMQPATITDETQIHIQPPQGIYTFNKNHVVNIEVYDSDIYEFLYLMISTEEDYDTIYSKTHTLNLDEDYDVKAYFGCANDNACINRFVCDTSSNQCIRDIKNASFFTLALGDDSPIPDVILSTKITSTLVQEGYDIPPKNAGALFSEINALDLDKKVTMAIYKNRIVTIIGSTSPADHIALAATATHIAINNGMSPENMTVKTSEEIERRNLYDLFPAESTPIEYKNASFFTIAIGNDGPPSDIALAATIAATLTQERYNTPIQNIGKLFSEINALDLDKKVTMAIYKNKIVTIIGTTSPADHIALAATATHIAINNGISTGNITFLLSEEIETRNLHDLFPSE